MKFKIKSLLQFVVVAVSTSIIYSCAMTPVFASDELGLFVADESVQPLLIDFAKLSDSSRRPEIVDIYLEYKVFRGTLDESRLSEAQKSAIDELDRAILLPGYSVYDINFRFLTLLKTIKYVNLNQEQKESLRRFQDSFKSVTVPASLSMEFIQTPEWGQTAEAELMARLEELNFLDILAKLTEGEMRALVIEYCGFFDSSLLKDDTDENVKKLVALTSFPEQNSFRWNVIKSVGTGEDLANTVFLTVPVEGYHMEKKKRSTCSLPVSVWAINETAEGYQWIPSEGLVSTMMK